MAAADVSTARADNDHLPTPRRFPMHRFLYRAGSPAYYLGRPADTWRRALRSRRRRTPVPAHAQTRPRSAPSRDTERYR